MPFFSWSVTAGVVTQVLPGDSTRLSYLVLNLSGGDCDLAHEPGMPAQYSFRLPHQTALEMLRELGDPVSLPLYARCTTSGVIYVAYSTAAGE